MHPMLDQAIGQKAMLSFVGTELPADFCKTLQRRHIGGVTLFRHNNLSNPAQVHELTTALQHAAAESGQPPLLIAVDQEGGQLIAIDGGTTHFPGNMALGATGSPDLAYATGYALGSELAAMGINVNYAPCCDVNINPRNPVIGIRSFGEDPAMVARLSAAMARGMQAAGVAATAKHFPGHGDTESDTHEGVVAVPHSRDQLRAVELPPFAAAIEAGVRLVMTAHVALPAFDEANLPATLSRCVLHGLLREELGFDGIIISDAMDMGAIAQGQGVVIDAIAAFHAGIDLLLLKADDELFAAIHAGLLQAVERRLLVAEEVQSSAARVLALKRWIAEHQQPPMEIVGCAEHQAIAQEIARRSVTLVRDEAKLLPLRLAPESRVAVIVPRPTDLTPADTSSYVECSLAQAARRYHSAVDEYLVASNPTASEIDGLREQIGSYDLAIVGTINALHQPGQVALMSMLRELGLPTVGVALRMPYDLLAFPTVPTYVCTYTILGPSMEALAATLWGQAPFCGKLPVTIPGLYALGHGLSL
ncbi:MAG: beta-N-acetylhexosaminidase [Chloroflexales bacterium]|nr:beta-N-acetylhexosaminidase [Chloroflexales bacterium]